MLKSQKGLYLYPSYGPMEQTWQVILISSTSLNYCS